MAAMYWFVSIRSRRLLSMLAQVQVSSLRNSFLIGKGAWPIEVADEYPTARLVGIDLAPIQPEMVPRNCEFVVGDFTVDLDEYHEGSVDLLHSRYRDELNVMI
jgi:hypothetical protein